MKLPITGTLNLVHMVITLKFSSQILSSFFIARFSVRVARAAARDYAATLHGLPSNFVVLQKLNLTFSSQPFITLAPIIYIQIFFTVILVKNTTTKFTLLIIFFGLIFLVMVSFLICPRVSRIH